MILKRVLLLMKRKQINHGKKTPLLNLKNNSPTISGLMDLVLLYSGFGFVTYKTVEAAKRAIDDPQKLLGVSFLNIKTLL